MGAERGGAAWGGGVILTPRDIALDGEGASSWTDPLDPIFSVRFGCSVFSDSCQFWLLPSARARAFDLDFSPHARAWTVVAGAWNSRVRRYLHPVTRAVLGLPGDPAARPRRARACCGRAEGASGAPTYGLLYTFFSISFYRFTDYRTAYRTRISMQAHGLFFQLLSVVLQCACVLHAYMPCRKV